MESYLDFAKELETVIKTCEDQIKAHLSVGKGKMLFKKHYLFPVQLMGKSKFTTDCIHDEGTRLVVVLNGIVDLVV